MAAKKTVGKITIDCNCGVTLECPATMKGEITCACGKSYGVNQERIVTLPQPINIPVIPYTPPADPYRPWRTQPWYGQGTSPPFPPSKIACVSPQTFSGVVSRISFTNGPRSAYL